MSALSEDQTIINILRNSLYPEASDDSIQLVLGYCRAAGLDPMQKPVHVVPMWDRKAGRMRDVIMPGIGLYRIQAARSGQFAGISEPVFGPDKTQVIGGVEITHPESCSVTARRRLPTGEICEFTATERWIENYAARGGPDKSVAPNTMWTRRPYGQLAKCAQAQALRMAFPEMTGAAPTADEMEGRSIDESDTRPTIAAPVAAQKPPYTDESIERNRQQWFELIESGKKTAEQIIAAIETKATLTDEQKEKIIEIGADAFNERLG